MPTVAILYLIGIVLIIWAALGKLVFPGLKRELPVLAAARVVFAVLGVISITLGTYVIVGESQVNSEDRYADDSNSVEVGRPLSASAEITVSAWTELDSSHFNEAISLAENCINQFELEARRLQDSLERLYPKPLNTASIKPSQHAEIFGRGVLNDVATCWFIKGRSHERLGDTTNAIEAFENAAQYTHAATWDPGQSLFWAPAVEARRRAEYLATRSHQ